MDIITKKVDLCDENNRINEDSMDVLSEENLLKDYQMHPGLVADSFKILGFDFELDMTLAESLRLSQSTPLYYSEGTYSPFFITDEKGSKTQLKYHCFPSSVSLSADTSMGHVHYTFSPSKKGPLIKFGHGYNSSIVDTVTYRVDEQGNTQEITLMHSTPSLTISMLKGISNVMLIETSEAKIKLFNETAGLEKIEESLEDGAARGSKAVLVEKDFLTPSEAKGNWQFGMQKLYDAFGEFAFHKISSVDIKK